MKPYVILSKKRGETPLMAVTTWKEANPAYADVPVSYAGRLDPMAEGKLIILLGDECKQQTKYTGLDKEYEIEVLVEVGSDTGDALGIVTLSERGMNANGAVLDEALKRERGRHTRAYPSYSSKTVEGKPLFLHALEGTIPNITVPEHEEHIYQIKLLGASCVTTDELRKRVEEFLALVPKTDEPSKMLGADFRVDAVRASWQQLFEKAGTRDFAILRLRVSCGSGTYMRSLAPRIGESLGTSALAFSIKRTKIGKYWNGLWLKSF